MATDREIIQMAMDRLSGIRIVGTMWPDTFIYPGAKCFAQVVVPSAIAVEAHQGPVLDGTARRVETRP